MTESVAAGCRKGGPARATTLASLASLTTLIALAATPAAAFELPNTRFGDCTEFVGVAPVPEAPARALVPQRFTPVVVGGMAQLVVRVADCRVVQVGRAPARAGRVGQIGLIIASPDGTATDPNTSINNSTLSYASNVPALVLALRAAQLPAALDIGLAYEVTPAAAGEFYAAVTPEVGLGSAWFLHGTVGSPTVPTSFLANWWGTGGRRTVKMATTIPAISFDFGSVVSYTGSRLSVVGPLLGGNRLQSFPVSFRGAFASGTMVVTTAPN